MNKYVCIRAQALHCLQNVKIRRLDNGLTLVESERRLTEKGLVCVTDNEYFREENLPFVQVKSVVLEGTDAVGKTSTIEGLIAQGIVCLDRDLTICKYMLFDVDMTTRCEAYEEYFKESKNTVIFLVNHSKEELKRRVFSRERISEFDKQTYEYNVLYTQTFSEMQNYQTNGKLKLVDCTNLSLLEQIERVKQVVLTCE